MFQVLKSLKPSYTDDDREMALSKDNKRRNRNPDVIPRMVLKLSLAIGITINRVTFADIQNCIFYIASMRELYDSAKPCGGRFIVCSVY